MNRELTLGRLVICRKTLHEVRREIRDIKEYEETITNAITIINQLADLKKRMIENGAK